MTDFAFAYQREHVYNSVSHSCFPYKKRVKEAYDLEPERAGTAVC